MSIKLNEEFININDKDVRGSFFELLLNTSLDKTIDSEAYKGLSLLTIDKGELEELVDKYQLNKGKLFELGLNLINLSKEYLLKGRNINFDNLYNDLINNKIDKNIGENVEDLLGNNILLFYCDLSEYNKIKKLIRICNFDYNHKNEFNDTALHMLLNDLLKKIKDIENKTFINTKLLNKELWDKVNNKELWDKVNLELYNKLKEIIFEILESDLINYNIQDDEGDTLLHLICKEIKLYNDDIYNIIKKIIESNRYDYNIRNNNKETIMHLLCSNYNNYNFNKDENIINYNSNNNRIYEILLKIIESNIYNYNIQDKEGYTILHYLCEKYYNETEYIIDNIILKIIRSDKYDYNIQDNEGNTILHLLCINLDNYNIRILKELININKLNRNIKNKYELTYLNYLYNNEKNFMFNRETINEINILLNN